VEAYIRRRVHPVCGRADSGSWNRKEKRRAPCAVGDLGAPPAMVGALGGGDFGKSELVEGGAARRSSSGHGPVVPWVTPNPKAVSDYYRRPARNQRAVRDGRQLG